MLLKLLGLSLTPHKEMLSNSGASLEGEPLQEGTRDQGEKGLRLLNVLKKLKQTGSTVQVQ